MAQKLRVAVAGAFGRMGTVAREALQTTGEYCCGLARARRSASTRSSIRSTTCLRRKPDVLLDLTTQPASYEISLAAVARGVPHCRRCERLERRAARRAAARWRASVASARSSFRTFRSARR